MKQGNLKAAAKDFEEIVSIISHVCDMNTASSWTT